MTKSIQNSKELDMNVDTYPPPVNKLLTYGASKSVLWQNWPNYAELGLGPEHIPDLIRMATDNELLWADSESLEVWAPIHAWRALGQFRAEAAIEPLLTLFEMPKAHVYTPVTIRKRVAYASFRKKAIPAITAYMADKSHGTSARIA